MDRYDEIHVFDGVAERTGTQLERAGVRGSRTVCRSFTELAAKSRRLGDGYYYLASTAWPEQETAINLNKPWESLA